MTQLKASASLGTMVNKEPKQHERNNIVRTL